MGWGSGTVKELAERQRGHLHSTFQLCCDPVRQCVRVWSLEEPYRVWLPLHLGFRGPGDPASPLRDALAHGTDIPCFGRHRDLRVPQPHHMGRQHARCRRQLAGGPQKGHSRGPLPGLFDAGGCRTCGGRWHERGIGDSAPPSARNIQQSWFLGFSRELDGRPQPGHDHRDLLFDFRDRGWRRRSSVQRQPSFRGDVDP